MSRKIISCEDCGAEFMRDIQCQNDITNKTLFSVVQKSQKIMKMICMMKKILNKIPQGLQIIGLGIIAQYFTGRRLHSIFFVTACFFLMLQKRV